MIRLFLGAIPPNAIVEHPPEIPTIEKDIPLGEIEGWEAYGPDSRTGGVVGPFKPVVETETYGDTRMTYIQVPGGHKFYFSEANQWLTIKRPTWGQGGETLRFIPARKA